LRGHRSAARVGETPPAANISCPRSPIAAPVLLVAPEIIQRRLFEAFRLQLRYHKPANTLTCRSPWPPTPSPKSGRPPTMSSPAQPAW
jgi:hypothetical protein